MNARQWSRDLRMGVRFAFTGGRDPKIGIITVGKSYLDNTNNNSFTTPSFFVAERKLVEIVSRESMCLIKARQAAFGRQIEWVLRDIHDTRCTGDISTRGPSASGAQSASDRTGRDSAADG